MYIFGCASMHACVCVRVSPLQNWLTDCARQITMVNHPTEWVTPLGLPVVQPYHMPTKIKEVGIEFDFEI